MLLNLQNFKNYWRGGCSVYGAHFDWDLKSDSVPSGPTLEWLGCSAALGDSPAWLVGYSPATLWSWIDVTAVKIKDDSWEAETWRRADKLTLRVSSEPVTGMCVQLFKFPPDQIIIAGMWGRRTQKWHPSCKCQESQKCEGPSTNISKPFGYKTTRLNHFYYRHKIKISIK
jgi:hypothetical protein